MPLLITRASTDERVVDHPAWRLYGIESYIAVPLQRRDGQLFGVLCALDPLPSSLTPEIVALFQLLAELIAFELEADERQRDQAANLAYAQQEAVVRDQFLASVAHDLKNPLATISGYAQVLRRQAEGGEAIPPARLLPRIERIQRSVTAMSASIDELLDLTRLQLDRSLELNREPVDLAELVRQIVSERPAAERSRLLLAGATSLIGDWDRARLTRVLQNLIGNALRYSPDDGPVTVTVERTSTPDASWAVVRVQDEGIGIPQADLPHIFEQFRRGRNAIGRMQGTGVGLFSVRQIVEQHGGTAAVESREGEGSTFTISLPL